MSLIYHQFHGFLAVDEATKWTPEIVAQRLIECFEVELTLPQPGGGGGFWSRARHSETDMAGWDWTELRKEVWQSWARVKPRASAEAIARADEALTWPMTYLKGETEQDRSQARVLLSWAVCKASHRSFDAVCRARRWKPSTVRRHRINALDAISDGLARDGVRVREAYAGDQMARAG